MHARMDGCVLQCFHFFEVSVCVCMYINIYKIIQIYVYIYIYIILNDIFIYVYLFIFKFKLRSYKRTHTYIPADLPPSHNFIKIVFSSKKNCPFLVQKCNMEFYVIVGSTSLTALRWSKRNDQSKPIFARISAHQLSPCHACLLQQVFVAIFPPPLVSETLRFEATLSGIGDSIRFQY